MSCYMAITTRKVIFWTCVLLAAAVVGFCSAGTIWYPYLAVPLPLVAGLAYGRLFPPQG